MDPFASACGYICTAPCETVCRRGVLDEPIAIRTLKRAAAELGMLPPIEPPAVRRMERIAIVGGGPAGMSAAYFLARLGYRSRVFEAQPVPGGVMAIGIPEYRPPKAILRLGGGARRDWDLMTVVYEYDSTVVACVWRPAREWSRTEISLAAQNDPRAHA